MTQDTSINSILHCIKLIPAVCLGLLYKQFKNMYNKQPPWRTLLPHKIVCSTSQEILGLSENLKGEDNYKTLHIKM